MPTTPRPFRTSLSTHDPDTELPFESPVLSTIRNQLLNGLEDIRFQCFANYGNPERPRCRESSKTFRTVFPKLFRDAKDILKHKNIRVDAQEFNKVARALFCEKHNKQGGARAQIDSLGVNWQGMNNSMETDLLELFRQTLRLSSGIGLKQDVDTPEVPSSRPTTPDTRQSSVEKLVSCELSLSPSAASLPRFDALSQRGTGSPRLSSSTRPLENLCSLRDPPTPCPLLRHTGTQSSFKFGGGQDSRPTDESGQNASGPHKCSFSENLIRSSFSSPFSTSTYPLPQSQPTASPRITIDPGSLTHCPIKLVFDIPKTNGEVTKKDRHPSPEIAAVEESSPEPAATLTPQRSPTPHSNPTAQEDSTSKPFKPESFLGSNWDMSLSSIQPPTAKDISWSTTIPQRLRHGALYKQGAKPSVTPRPTYLDTSNKAHIPQVSSPSVQKVKDYALPPFDLDICTAITNNFKWEEGFVYILKAPKYFEENHPNETPWLKIGKAKDMKSRRDKIRKGCGIEDLDFVEDDENVASPLYGRIEVLVHAELKNSKKIMVCKKHVKKKDDEHANEDDEHANEDDEHATGKDTQHREWFAVSEEMALASVKRWRRFVLQDPYDENGILKAYWSNMITKIKTPHPENREGDDDKIRNRRWNGWLDEAIANAPRDFTKDLEV